MGKICFVFEFILHIAYTVDAYQHTAVTVLDRNDILYGGHKSDAGVGPGRRRRFLG
jgi:hypothetical protein